MNLRVYDIGRPMERLFPLAEHQKPNLDRRIDTIELADEAAFGGPADHFVAVLDGTVVCEAAGEYIFRLVCDDGARLTIDGDMVVDHDGVHAPSGKDGTVSLAAGPHAYRIDYFENEGGAELRLLWKPPGAAALATVPAAVLFVDRVPERMTSPGHKQVLDGMEHARPGDGMPLEGVHPGWAVEDLRPAGFEPMVGGMAFLPDGRLVLTSFEPVNDGVLKGEPNGTVWVLRNVIGGNPGTVQPERIAGGFYDPTGLAVVDGAIYIAHKPDITKIWDSDGDGKFDRREVFAKGWVSDNYHHFAFGMLPKDGYLYGTLSTSIYFDNTMKADHVIGDVVAMNGPNPEHRGTCWRVNLETREFEYLAGGLRTPNGIGEGPEGEIFVSDNQGAWLPSSKLINIRPGRFYGHSNGRQRSDRYPLGGYPSLNEEHGFSPPAVWLPQNACCNSPTMPIMIRGGEFAGQMYLGELTMGGIRRIFLEKVDGEWQGVAFRFTQGFESGVNRLIEGPDGCLYIGGTGSSGNWSWRGTRTGLQRLRPTGGSAFEYHSISATPDGFVIRLTRPVEAAWLANPANYSLTEWRYDPTPNYGGPNVDTTDLGVASATPAADGRSVRLVVPGLKPGYVVHFRIDPRSADGEAMWSTEAWYTLNRIPR
ncbi:MAG: hypothetical protein IPJ41_06420 [Phycisphaerales bacterium]|nr:hypothetical protein [Phycisphaerales bacterium]